MSDPIRLPDGSVTTDYEKGWVCTGCDTFHSFPIAGKVEVTDQRTRQRHSDPEAPMTYGYDVTRKLCGDCMDRLREFLGDEPLEDDDG